MNSLFRPFARLTQGRMDTPDFFDSGFVEQPFSLALPRLIAVSGRTPYYQAVARSDDDS